MADRTEDTSAAFSLFLLFAHFAQTPDNSMNALAIRWQVLGNLTVAIAALFDTLAVNPVKAPWANCAPVS